MKVLISDDEFHVIQAIRLLVPWEEFGIDQIFTASSGAEAMEIIRREVPELVITDIVMDDKNGMDVMHFIASEYPSIKVIAVSGHNDFEYVRTMLTKGCTDYLLKPLESSTLIQAVKKAVLSWKSEHESTLMHQNLQEQVHSLSALYSGILLFKMLNSNSMEETYQELVHVNPAVSAIHKCRVIFFDTQYLPMHQEDFVTRLEKFEQKAEETLEKTGAGLLLSNPDAPNEIMIFLHKTEEPQMTVLQKNAQALFARYSSSFHMGVSMELDFPMEFPRAYVQAKQAYFSSPADGPAPITIMVSEDSSMNENSSMDDVVSNVSVPEQPSKNLHQMEEHLISALLIGSQAEIEKAVKPWIAAFLPEENVRLYHIQQIMASFTSLYRHWITTFQKKNPQFCHNPELCVFSYPNFLDKDCRFSREYLTSAMVSDLCYLWDESKKSSSNTDRMHQIAQYMELNYTKPFIQSEYAKLFYINKDYMCRKFKDTFGVSMLAYLNQIRIEHAKALLNRPDMKIRDIAYAVGFEDEKYFARQFKKHTTMTPGDYRTGFENPGT